MWNKMERTISLREDLEVSHRAITSWMNILESFYYCFRIYPYAAKNFRSLKKEAKLNDVKASPHLFYFRDKLKIPFSYQVVKQNGVDSFTNGVRIVSASKLLAGLV